MPPTHEYPIAPPPQETTTTSPAPSKSGWVHRHPYLTALIGGVSLIVLAILVVGARSGVTGSDSANNWVGAGSVFFTGGRNLTPEDRIAAEQAIKQKSPDTQLGYIPIQMQSADGGVGDDFGNDLTKLLGLLTQPAKTSGASATPPTSDAYSLIPQGLISVAESSTPRTGVAEVLFSYGNEIGTYIQGYESMHYNSSQTLKDQAEDRTNAEKGLNVKNLGYDMAALGRDLLQMDTVPKNMQAMHNALATSYRIAGTNLTKIADAKTDQEFLDAIAAYNASVEALAKRFLVVVTYFSANNVQFSSSDPGSIFIFNSKFAL